MDLYLRDGATGSGTIIWRQAFVFTAVTGNLITPVNFCGLNLLGSQNTALTLEFSAGVANVIESVTVTGTSMF